MADESTVYRFRGDNSDLKQTLRENQQVLKAAARDASATKVRIVAQLDVTRAAQQARVAVRMLEASLPPIRIRLAFAPPGGGFGRSPMLLPSPGGAGGGGMGGGGGGAGIGGGYVPNWRGGGGGSGWPAGTGSWGSSVSSGGGPGWQGGNAGSSAAWQTPIPMAFRPGTQQNAAFRASQAGGGGFLFGRNTNGLGPLVTLGLVAGGARAAGGFRDAYRDYTAIDPARRVRGVQGMLSAGEQVPIFGAGVQFARQWSGYDRMAETAQRDAEAKARAQDAIKSRSKDVEIDRAALRGDDAEVIRLEGEKRVQVAKQHALLSNDSSGIGINAERGITSSQLADLRTRNSAFSRGEEARGDIARESSAGIQAYNAGDLMAAAMHESHTGRIALRESGLSRLDGIKDPKKIRDIKAANDREMQAYNDRSNMELDQRQKERDADVASARAARQEASLRIAKQTYAADLSAFDAMSKAKIDAIQDVEGKRNEADRTAAQRAVMVAQHQQQVAENISMSTAGEKAANLRAGQRGFEASLVEFDAAAKNRLDKIEDPQERASAKAEIDARRREMQTDHNRQVADIRGSLTARTASAGAAGQFNDRLAGTIGLLAGMDSELRGADAEVRDQLVGTQKAELAAMRDRMVRGNPDQRAIAFDPRRMAGSANADRSAKESLNILKLIEQHLAKLAGGGGVPVAG